MDIEFDDYVTYGFSQYKDVRIHAIEVYESNTHICGMEVYYITDGDNL
jgi:hypothetical protein